MSGAPLLPIRIQAKCDSVLKLVVATGASFAEALTDSRKLQQHKTAIIDLGFGSVEDLLFVLLSELTQFFNEDRILFTGYEFIETGDEERVMISVLGEKVLKNIHALACDKLAPAERGNLSVETGPDGQLVLDYALIPEE